MLLIGKSSINGPFSMAMLNYQRVMGIISWFTNQRTTMILWDIGNYGIDDVFNMLQHCSTYNLQVFDRFFILLFFIKEFVPITSICPTLLFTM